jgi:DNA polymerase III delta subunit
LRRSPEASKLLLVVDQFEEAFIATNKPSSLKFQHLLVDLARNSDCYIILTVRADFYDRLMTSPIWERVEHNRFEVQPMKASELREAIEAPAAKVGVYIEAALIERLVSDAVGQPGVLPLL